MIVLRIAQTMKSLRQTRVQQFELLFPLTGLSMKKKMIIWSGITMDSQRQMNSYPTL